VESEIELASTGTVALGFNCANDEDEFASSESAACMNKPQTLGVS
jgi:hypothetical protein